MRHLDDDAIARALLLEHNIDLDLQDPAKSILLAQLARARKAAIEATKLLVECPPFEAQRIMRLQNEVRRFADLHDWLLNAQTRAGEAWAALPDDEREAVIAFTNPNTEINDA
jgi:hypothetical protein